MYGIAIKDRLPESAGRPLSDRESNHQKRWWILSVLGVAQLMVILDNSVVNIALPSAQGALRFSNADRQWIVTAYSLAFGSLLLLGGRLGDMMGRKRALVTGLIGFAVASAIGGASVSFSMLVIARSVQGAFGALLAPSVLALLTTTFNHPSERGRAFAIYGAIAGGGGALGLVLGGILTSYASWRWTLFINLPFAAFAIAGALLWMKNDRGVHRDPLDYPGLVLATTGLFFLVFGFSHAETTSWSNPYTVGFLGLGVFLLAVFALLETRVRFPLLPLRIVANRTRGGSLLTMLIANAGTFGVFLFLTYYLQGTLGWSPVASGSAFLPMMGSLMITSQLSNRVILARFGPKFIVPSGLLLDALALYMLHRVGLRSSYATDILPYLIVLGVGFGLSISPSFSTGTLGLARNDAGVGSAALNSSQQVGGSIGTALLNTLAAGAVSAYLVGRALTPANLKAAALHSYTMAFLWTSLIFVGAAIVAVALFERGNLAELIERSGTDPSGQRPDDVVTSGAPVGTPIISG